MGILVLFALVSAVVPPATDPGSGSQQPIDCVMVQTVVRPHVVSSCTTTEVGTQVSVPSRYDPERSRFAIIDENSRVVSYLRSGAPAADPAGNYVYNLTDLSCTSGLLRGQSVGLLYVECKNAGNNPSGSIIGNGADGLESPIAPGPKADNGADGNNADAGGIFSCGAISQVHSNMGLWPFVLFTAALVLGLLSFRRRFS